MTVVKVLVEMITKWITSVICFWMAGIVCYPLWTAPLVILWVCIHPGWLMEWQGRRYLKIDWAWSQYPPEANARIDFLASFSELIVICIGIYLITCLAYHKHLLAKRSGSKS